MASGGDLRGASYALSLTTRLLPIAFLVAGAWADGRAAFYDLLVKRLTLTVLAIVALALAVSAVRPVVAPFDAARAGWVSGLLLAPLVLLLVGAARVVSDWLDARWLGRRYSPGDAIERLLAVTRGTDDRDELERRALEVIGELFDGTATLVPADARRPVAGTHVAVAPVDEVGAVEVIRRDESRRFYSEDLALVRSVAHVLGLEFARAALERQRQAEAARALRAQINPHFLFNALNTIGGWVQADPRRAEGIIEQLAEVFRYTLRGTTSEWATLDAELGAVRRYLDVEHARFGDRLVVGVTCDDDVSDVLVPPLVVLTLAENAVKHGVAPALGTVSVTVHAQAERDRVRVDVVDTGEGLDAAWAAPDARRAGGFGLASVRERLRLLYGTQASLEGSREAARGETRFSLRVPLRRGSAAG
ncbi:MAG: sensor histidine kinase [Vicinamibacteria bacterium]